MEGRYYDFSAISYFIRALQSEQKSVLRKLLMTALNERQVQIPEEVLVRLLDDDSEEVRALAVNALEHSPGSWALKSLKIALNDHDERVRLAAIRTLGALHDMVPVLHILSPSNHDSGENERLAAVKAAGEWIDPATSKRLRAVASHDSSSSVRALATKVLALQKNVQIVDDYLIAPSIKAGLPSHTVAELRDRLAESSIIDDLIIALADQDAPARPIIAETLSKLHDPALIETFANALLDQDKRIHAAALTYLSQFDDERALHSLAPGLIDARQSVCEAVFSIMEKYNGPHLTDVLLKVLQDTPAPKSWYIIGLLSQQQEQRSQAAMAVLTFILKHIHWYAQDHTCQFSAAFTLANVCTEEVFFRLVSLINESQASIEVRSFVATTLREVMTPRTREHQHLPEQHMLKPLATALYDPLYNKTPAGRRIRHDLAYTLAQLNHPDALQPLLGLLSLPEPSYWEVKIVADSTGVDVIEPFLALSNDLSRLPEMNLWHSLEIIEARLIRHRGSDPRITEALIKKVRRKKQKAWEEKMKK
jgi:HEAT repeat protein